MCQPLTKRANVLKINKNTKTKYHNDDDDDGDESLSSIGQFELCAQPKTYRIRH
jgi:hypothetical protein